MTFKKINELGNTRHLISVSSSQSCRHSSRVKWKINTKIKFWCMCKDTSRATSTFWGSKTIVPRWFSGNGIPKMLEMSIGFVSIVFVAFDFPICHGGRKKYCNKRRKQENWYVFFLVFFLFFSIVHVFSCFVSIFSQSVCFYFFFLC